MTKEEIKAKKSDRAKRFPGAYLKGVGCDIRMDEGSAFVQLCFHGDNGKRAQKRNIDPNDLAGIREVIAGFICRYNERVRALNLIDVAKMESADEVNL